MMKDNKQDELGGEQAFTPRRRNRRMGDRQQGPNIWLISFTDVMALMLTFFVLLFAMSNPKQDDWEQFTQNIQKNFNRFYGQIAHKGDEDAINIEKVNLSRALDLRYLKALIGRLIEEEKSLQGVRLMNSPRNGLVISLPQDILFETGQAVVKSEANEALFTIAASLGRIQNRIEIEGHSDPRPTRGGPYPSNWELSLARAASVAAVLENVGYERSITVRGQSSGRYSDLPDNVSEEEKLTLSRRVDIIVMEDDGQRIQFFDLGFP